MPSLGCVPQVALRDNELRQQLHAGERALFLAAERGGGAASGHIDAALHDLAVVSKILGID